MRILTFQSLINKLQDFWSDKGCLVLQPYDAPVGAGTLHPATAFSVCQPDPWNVVYVQPVRRPDDGRFNNHFNRVQHYYQLQVLLKPVPDDFLELYLKSLEHIGINNELYDLNIIEDDWKSPTLGAFGLGWEVVCNGMEIAQITYMRQIANIDCTPHIGEITYGLERTAMIIQNVVQISDIIWHDKPQTLYKQIFAKFENEFSQFNFEYANIQLLVKNFEHFAQECERLVQLNLPYPAYDCCLYAIHIFNLLSARGILSPLERERYVAKTQNLSFQCIHTLKKLGAK